MHIVVMVICMAIEDFKNFVRANPFIKEAVDSHKISWQKAYEHYDIYHEDNWDFLKDTKEEVTSEPITTTKSSSIPLPNLADIDFHQVGKVLEQITNLVGMAKELLNKNTTEDTLEKRIYERYKD